MQLCRRHEHNHADELVELDEIEIDLNDNSERL